MNIFEPVPVFFYGTFMSARILTDFGVRCDETIPSKLTGFELTISPRVNLVKKPSSSVYGGIAFITHNEIMTLYKGLEVDYNITYHPFPVVVDLLKGGTHIALCYISFDNNEGKANSLYINEMCACATEMKAPASYIQHIKSFLPNSEQGSGGNG